MLSRLTRAIKLLVDAETAGQIIDTVTDAAAEALGADLASVGLVDPSEPGVLALLDVRDGATTDPDKWSTIDLSVDSPQRRVLESREPIYLDREGMLAEYPHFASTVAASSRQAWAVLPILSPTQKGVIGLGWSEQRAFDDEERTMLEAIGALASAMLESAAARADRQRLLVEASLIAEAERRLIAEQLHDGPVTWLASAAMLLGGTAMGLEDPREDDDLVGDVNRALELVQLATKSLRTLMIDHYPPDFDSGDLSDAIAALSEWVLGDHPPDVHLDVDPTLEVTSSRRRLVLRVLLEALTNVKRHAAASNVSVSVRSRDEGLELTVRDDGVGYALGILGTDDHVGTRIMRDRVELSGGELSIESSGMGTTVTALIGELTS